MTDFNKDAALNAYSKAWKSFMKCEQQFALYRYGVVMGMKQILMGYCGIDAKTFAKIEDKELKDHE